MSFYSLSKERVLSEVDSSLSGLSTAEARLRLKKVGPNEIRLKRSRSIIRDLIEPFKSVFVLILLAAALISVFLDKRLDAAVISAIVVFNAIIYYVQRITADRALKALKKKDTQRVQVIREGKQHQIEARLLVPGDVLLVHEGMKVPADGRLLEVNDLTIDESLLTGESLPVVKKDGEIAGNPPIYDQTNMVFQGSFVTAGYGRYVVTATGNSTEVAQIAKLSREDKTESPLQQKIDKLTSKIVLMAILASGLAFVLGILRGIPIGEMLRFALSMTVSAVPEGLPVTLAIVLVFGVSKMAKKNALVRNLFAVETLGQTTMIATDKTGTITKNELAIAQRWHPQNNPGELDEAAWLALAHTAHHTDPLEQVLADELKQDNPQGWKHLKSLPFNQALRASGSIWRHSGGYELYLKGAPESLIEASTLTSSQEQTLKIELQRLTRQGYRLIGFASKHLSEAPNQFKSIPSKLKFEGVIAFSDQLRPEIPAAIDATHAAGIKVIMVTGDHLETARTFGKQSGIINNLNESAEGRQIEALTLTQLRQLLKKVRVFGRVLPQHKYKILEAVDRTEVTAMTGDGVNDVPAIVKADVGLAMGNGTDAAKEASDVVLLDSNYATIVEAIKEGRTILANVRKMVFYLFATNLGEVLTMLGALIVGLPLPLTAIHVLWVNLVTDGFTVIPLGLEPAEEHHMRRSPEKPSQPLLSRKLLYRVISTSILMAVITLTVFWIYLPLGLLPAQTMAFATLVVVQWANVLNARSEQSSFLEGLRRPNFWLWGAILASMALQAVVFWGPLQSILGVVALGARELLVLAVASVIVLVAGDIFKRLFK